MFSEEIEHILSAGEKTGELGKTLKSLHEYLNWKEKLRKQVVSVAIYPTTVLTLVLLIIGIIFSFVIPKFEKVILKMGGAVPYPTQILMNISSFMSQNYGKILIAMAIVFFGYKIFKKYKGAREIIDRVMLNIPIIGDINNMISQSKFCRNFLIMNESGIAILENLEITSKLTGNKIFEHKIIAARELIKEGENIITSFKQQNIFSFIVIKMIEAGEKTGDLDSAFKHINKYYDSEIPFKVQKMIKIFEFLTILILGAVVLIVGISIMLPMLDLLGGIKK